MPGHKIGNYRLNKRLGKGGCGEVWQALDLPLKRHVAIKFNICDDQDAPAVIARFRAEGVLASRITHPSLVQMYATGQTDEGVLFHVMELVEGQSLWQRINPAPDNALKLDAEFAMDLAWQIAVVMEPLHSRVGIVHRDLKPGNLMLVDDETMPHGIRVKLIDFGIAKFTDREQAKELELGVATTKGFILGSPVIMPPEQWHDDTRKGPEIDVYALGCILYRLIAGTWPFEGNPEELRGKHQFIDPALLTEVDPQINPELAMLVHRMLAKKPAERPTMLAVRDELARLLGVKSAVAGQVVIRSTLEMSAIQGELLSVSMELTADAPVSASSTPPDGPTNTKQRQQSAAGAASSTRRGRLIVGLAGGLVGLVSVATLVQSTRAPRVPANKPVPSASSSASASAIDLGASRSAGSIPAPASTVEAPKADRETAAATTNSAPVLPSSRDAKVRDKKHRRKKKDDIMVSEGS